MSDELSGEQLDRQNAALSRSIELPLLNVAAPSPRAPPTSSQRTAAARPPSALPLRSTKRAASGAMDSRDGIQKLLAAEQEAQTDRHRCATQVDARDPRSPPSSSSARALSRHQVEHHSAGRPPFRTPSAEKTARMRQAKEEADAEVAAYRAQREATYQKMLAEVRARTHPLFAPQIRRVPKLIIWGARATALSAPRVSRTPAFLPIPSLAAKR